MDWTVKITDLAIIIATLAGPILAIQTQKFIERIESKRNIQIGLFKTLMATRLERVSQTHVNALNMIPIEFYGNKYKIINDAWKSYIAHLGQKTDNQEAWNQRCDDLFTTLIRSIAEKLGYNFYDSEIRREIYSPIAHSKMQTDNEIIRSGLIKILSGETAIPMEVTSLPVDPEASIIQLRIQEKYIDFLKSESDKVKKPNVFD